MTIYQGFEHDFLRGNCKRLLYIAPGETFTRLETGLYGLLVTFLTLATILLLCTNPAVWTNRAPITRLPRAQQQAVLTQESERAWVTPILQGKRELTPYIVKER